MRTIITPPGIGDNIWLMQKLVNQKEQFHFRIPDGQPQRGKQIFDLLPQVAASCEYTPGLTYKLIEAKNNLNTKRFWSKLNEQNMYLSANSHLERGRRIDLLLPDLPTSYKLNYATTEDDSKRAAELLPEGKKYIGIYTSAYSNARNWGAWEAREWFGLIKGLKGKNRVFVIIGAEYDTGVVEELTKAMDEAKIKYINTTGEPLSVVIELLKRLSYFIGFPSGLSILNETLGKDGLMFYAAKIQKIINTWAEPARIKAGNIKECLFTEPEKVMEWLKNDYKIFDKMALMTSGNI